MLHTLAVESWRRTQGRIDSRAAGIAASGSSFGRRGLLWNCYGMSLLPYPSRVVPPTEATIVSLEEACRSAIQPGARWCPLAALSALGVMFDTRNAPRCPRAACQALGAWAFANAATWGPGPARRAQRALWTLAVQHADTITRGHYEEPVWSTGARVRNAASRVLSAADARFTDPRVSIPRSVGSGLYDVLWHRLHLRTILRWTRGRSMSRRWAPGDGLEWSTLGHAPSATDAARILRLLCNGLPGAARWRPSSQRRPRQCRACGSGDIAVAWRSPSPPLSRPGDPGLAWCAECLPFADVEQPWQCLPRSFIPEALPGYPAAHNGSGQLSAC